MRVGKRFNVIIVRAEDADEKSENWIPLPRVHDLLRSLAQDDKLVIQRVEDAERGNRTW